MHVIYNRNIRVNKKTNANRGENLTCVTKLEGVASKSSIAEATENRALPRMLLTIDTVSFFYVLKTANKQTNKKTDKLL